MGLSSALLEFLNLIPSIFFIHTQCYGTLIQNEKSDNDLRYLGHFYQLPNNDVPCYMPRGKGLQCCPLMPPLPSAVELHMTLEMMLRK